MANFFKDYQAELRVKREAEEQEKQKAQEEARKIDNYIESLPRGKRVKINKRYAENGFLYFADILSENSVLLSDDKENAKAGRGWIKDKNIIILEV